MRKPFVLFVALFAAVYAAHHKHHFRVPIIDLAGADEFVGTIAEDGRTVSVSPRISIVTETGPICRYDLKSLNGDDLPFVAEVSDKSLGSAVIRLKDGASLDCSHTEFRISLTAVRCADDNSRSEAATLKVTVKDTNNHAPEFDAPWYSFEIDEGKIVSEIARIEATDKDCGHPYGKICRYEITNTLEKNPFKIDDQGVLSNTRPLNFSDGSSHILTIVAHDCGMRHSKSTLVTVNVRQRCTDGLKNSPSATVEPIEYAVGSGSKTVLPEAEVLLCPRDPVCTVKSAESRLTLNLERTGEHSLEAAKKCGMSAATLELLPRPKFADEKIAVAPIDEASDNMDDDEDDNDIDDEEKPSEKYLFDGKSNAVIVPSTTMKEVIPEHFTLTFSMKHDRGTKREQSVKQNILCESDELGMNRHHFAVYLRHCKLELLLRREAKNAAPEFRAAEWRWDTPEVCDNEWHSYAIIFTDLDNVTLLVDGEKFHATDRNPEILDDWPLHETKQAKTRVVVGACWHARNQAMVQFFNGHLSSMYLLPGAAEPETSVQCLHAPKERILFDAIDQLVPGESAIFSKDQNQLSLKANTLEDLSLLLQKVKYSNDVTDASASKRRMSVTSKVTCNESREIPLGTYETSIAIQKATTPVLSISGQNLLDTDRRSLKVGTIMLPDVQITVTQNKDGKETDVTGQHNLDWCKVHLKPSRDMDLEYFSSPAALIASLNIDFEHDKQGILLKGDEGAKGYQQILEKIHYFNTRPEAYAKRMYTVQCAMMKGKVLSNEFVVTATIRDDVEEELTSLSKKLDQIVPGSSADETDYAKLEKHFEPSFDQIGANRLQNILEMDLPRPKALLSHHGYEVGQGAVAGGAVAIVVVICVGFLLVLLIVGVVKMREPVPRRRRNRKSLPEGGMEWDDSGMNITVNPLEDVEKREQVEMDAYSESEEVRSESDDESYHEEDELTDEEEETEAVLPHAQNRQGLEWDDSTLTNVSKTYRV